MKLTATMIVKNEEYNIRRCLQSINDFMDQIIVIDTGSTDATKDILRDEYPKVTLVETRWKNDFSYHRNQAFDWAEYYKADWMFVIDADEQLAKHIPWIKRVLDSCDKNGVEFMTVLMRDYRQDGSIATSWPSPRIFRAKCGFQYERAIQNRIEGLRRRKGAHPQGLRDTIILNHYGYTADPERFAVKLQERIHMLRNHLADHPEDMDAHYYFAAMYVGNPDLEIANEALKHAYTFWEMLAQSGWKPGDPLWYWKALWHIVGTRFLLEGDTAKARITFETGLRNVPDDLTLNYDMALVASMTKDSDTVMTAGEAFLRNIVEFRKNPVKFGKVLCADPRYEENVKLWMEAA